MRCACACMRRGALTGCDGVFIVGSVERSVSSPSAREQRYLSHRFQRALDAWTHDLDVATIDADATEIGGDVGFDS